MWKFVVYDDDDDHDDDDDTDRGVGDALMHPNVIID